MCGDEVHMTEMPAFKIKGVEPGRTGRMNVP